MSIAGGFSSAIEDGIKIGCTTMQIFTKVYIIDLNKLRRDKKKSEQIEVSERVHSFTEGVRSEKFRVADNGKQKKSTKKKSTNFEKNSANHSCHILWHIHHISSILVTL
jgi:hypothetical protein